MRIAILPDEKTIARVAADRIEALYTRKPHFVLGLATGSTPLPLYAELVERYNAGRISFAHVSSYNLDEYIGLPEDHYEGYANFIHRNLVDLVDFAEGAAHGPNAWTGDSHAAAAAYDEAIRAAGGIDLQVLGIGSDGHIGFNEPAGSLSSRTHVGVLTEQTRRDNSRFFEGNLDAVPTHCITQGLGTIMEARENLMIATGENKAEAVKELVEGPISGRWPATILQMHNNTIVLLDEAAASRLDMKDFYREVWEKEQLPL
ncbi:MULTISPECIES: glucosamine-6-phosphate deaminase [unclassified Schaalia]|uniref:glucosamine-6-phosphate deaminase n=1 Tax=unclassified Schaalia TaxID=2691889 RepID=UPI001E6249E6|nr:MULTISPECIES: glucosamine-6-phosphate deaminase [unclassified Schaalia]MCD4550288.1 glucosamine-6-phosphate deaminase [Schaalia sp. lx-260]MCD4558094.1 glucosamine-6-phosphate deaminase [Schaalia sp. lx-100]